MGRINVGDREGGGEKIERAEEEEEEGEEEEGNKLEPWTVCELRCFTHIRLFSTPWTIARQAPLSIGFSRQEYWSGLPFPLPDGRYGDN